MKKTLHNGKQVQRSLMTTLLGFTLLTVIALAVISGRLLFRVMRSQNLQVAQESTKDLVECHVSVLDSKYTSFISQLSSVAEICGRKHWNEKECMEFVDILVSKSNGSFLYGGFVRHNGTVVSTVDDTINTASNKYAMEQLCKYGRTYMISQPYNASNNPNRIVQNLLVPVNDGERVRGALYVAVDTYFLLEELSYIKYNGMGVSYLCNANNASIALSEKGKVSDFSGTNAEICDSLSVFINKGNYCGVKPYKDKDGQMRLVAWSMINESHWFVMTEIMYDELDQSRTRMRNVYCLAGLSIFGLMVICMYLLLKFKIVKPLVQLQNVLNDFAAGRMYRAVNLNHGLKNEIGLLYDDMEDMANKLSKITDSIRSQSVAIRDSSCELMASSEHIRESVSEQASAVGKISATIEQITSSISETTSIAAETQTSSKNISDDINNVAKASAQTLESIKTIIQKIKVINDIAKRTDFLAINAAVEAARAGDNGRGFSTVAAEIKQLAERTKNAAALIDEASNQTLSITTKSTKMIEQIAPKILNNSSKVTRIALACAEQRQGTEQINNAIQQLAHVADETNIEGDALAVKSETFVQYANELISAIRYFKTTNEREQRLKEITEELEKHTSDLEDLRRDLAEYDQHVVDVAVIKQTMNNDEKDVD